MKEFRSDDSAEDLSTLLRSFGGLKDVMQPVHVRYSDSYVLLVIVSIFNFIVNAAIFFLLLWLVV